MSTLVTLFVVFVGLIILGTIVKLLGKLAGEEGAEGLGGLISGCGEMGCGCMLWLIIIPVVGLLLLLLLAGASNASPIFE
jgi:hypothetical protein